MKVFKNVIEFKTARFIQLNLTFLLYYAVFLLIHLENCSSKEGTYIGCFVDDGERDLNQGPKDYGYNPETCNTACQDYSYYALQNNGWCACGNGYSTKPKYIQKNDDDCGGPRGFGGGWRNSVYKTCRSVQGSAEFCVK